MATSCSLLSRLRAICSPASRAFANRTFSILSTPIPQLRPLIAVSKGLRLMTDCRGAAGRWVSTWSTTSSIQDPSPASSERPPNYTPFFDDGCDYEHWLVVVEKPNKKLTRDEIIDSYIKILAQVIGSEEEARMKIYSVSTKHYFAFGALVSEELSDKIKALPSVRWVLPDCYLNVIEKNYGGEPFINGQAVPYDPKFHEEWAMANYQLHKLPKRVRPHYYDRSMNFEQWRENMQSREHQTREAPPMPKFQNAAASPAQPGHNVPSLNSPNQMPSNSSASPNQGPNAHPGYGCQAGSPHSGLPGGQGFQSGLPDGQGFQASVMGNQDYQAGPPDNQGHQAGPLGGQGYQFGPHDGKGYQTGSCGGQGYQTSPGSHGDQVSQSLGHGYQGGPPCKPDVGNHPKVAIQRYT